MGMSVEQLQEFSKNCMISNLGIEYTEITEDSISATMPVDERTVQPFGYLHGGAMLALGETLASAGSVALLDDKHKAVFGISVSGNHLKSTREGKVTGIAKIIHKGRSVHTWEISIYDGHNALLSKCIATNKIVNLHEQK